MMISLFNLTTPGKMPILIRVVPEDPAEVNVFVRLNSTPTSTEYDWFLTYGFNGTNNYTMYISAEQTVGVNNLFIGVQSPTGILIHHLSFYSPEGSTSEHMIQIGWPPTVNPRSTLHTYAGKECIVGKCSTTLSFEPTTLKM